MAGGVVKHGSAIGRVLKRTGGPQDEAKSIKANRRAKPLP
jgi:hypothetical protein